MEHRLLSDIGRAFDPNPNFSRKSTGAIIALITNSFTSDQTLTSVLETLILHLQNPNSNHQKILSLLSALSRHHPRLCHLISAAAHSFIVLPSTPTSSIPHALLLIDPAHSTLPNPFHDESLFLSLCFWQCVRIRGWILRNVTKFCVSPSVLLMDLLGFTKDPYPNIRGLALDGLAMLTDGILVEDRSLVDGCYFRAVELLFDAENSVRHSAISAVSKWGQFLVTLSSDETKSERSDALFVQGCKRVETGRVVRYLTRLKYCSKLILGSNSSLKPWIEIIFGRVLPEIISSFEWNTRVEIMFSSRVSSGFRVTRSICCASYNAFLTRLCLELLSSDWSFNSLCLMVRDTEMEIRVAAFNALGTIQTVSEDILLQTLSKKALLATKEKFYPGQYTAKLFKIPATTAAFAFVHGLEDEFYQVRTSACHALQMLMVLSAKFARGAVHLLMDMLNDDSLFVRLQALETLHHMAMHDHLKVEESHVHMLFGALVDNNALIRSTVRKTLQFTKLHKLAMVKSCIDGLVKNLELYPQDESDIFHVLYKIGQIHGKFVTRIIHEVSQELEPSVEGKLVFDKVRAAALLLLAISTPVSIERQICSIPPQLYSYAVTLLGRLSRGLFRVMDQNTLLAYLSHCSRFTISSTSESFEGEVLDFSSEDSYLNLSKMSDETSSLFPGSLELKDVTPSSPHDYLLNANVKASNYMEIVFRKVVDLWPLIHIGCTAEVVRILRNLKEELKNFSRESRQPAGVLVFAMKYLRVIKLLGEAWACCFSQRNLQFKGMGFLETLLGTMERRLKEMLYRFPGLSREGKLHILELLLVSYVLRLSCRGPYFFEICMKKVNFVLRRVENLRAEGSIELSKFITDLQNKTCEISNSEDGLIDTLDLFQKSLHLFSLKRILLSEELEYIEAEVDVRDNDWENPFPFVSGLPVGLPLDITLSHVSSETRLWVAISLGEKSTQFVFLDLHEFGGYDALRKFTFVATFYRTPKVKHLLLKVSVAMECLSEDQNFEQSNGRKHELIYLSKGKEVHLSMAC
ncbi:hypothetical protein OROHE_013366 [Orobanche hederae]